MVKVMAALVMLVVFMLQSARAEDGRGMVEDAMRKDPDRFRTMAEDVIAGFGGPSGLTPAGIEDHIAVQRAVARAAAMRRLLAMDLDNDGTVIREELAVTLRAASASGRGRLERQFAAADTDEDGQIGSAEIRTEGQIAALRSLTPDEAGVLRALMTLDADQDGSLRLDELHAAMAGPDEAT